MSKKCSFLLDGYNRQYHQFSVIMGYQKQYISNLLGGRVDYFFALSKVITRMYRKRAISSVL